MATESTVQLPPGSFYGEPIKSYSAGGWGFSESLYPAGIQIARHTHENAFFYLMIAGACTEVYGNRSRLSEPASLVFHPAGESHANHWHAGSEGRCFHLELDNARLASLREHAPVLDRPADFQGGMPVWLAARLYREFRRRDALSPLAMEGLLLELLAETSRNFPNVSERHPPRWLRQARMLLEERFCETLSVEEVAEAVGVHPSHLVRVFRQQYRCTMGDYIRRLRIERACRQLATSDTPLAEIALSLGFSDQSHFSKTFKLLIGLAPAAFRRSHRLCGSDTGE